MLHGPAGEQELFRRRKAVVATNCGELLTGLLRNSEVTLRISEDAAVAKAPTKARAGVRRSCLARRQGLDRPPGSAFACQHSNGSP